MFTRFNENIFRFAEIPERRDRRQVLTLGQNCHLIVKSFRAAKIETNSTAADITFARMIFADVKSRIFRLKASWQSVCFSVLLFILLMQLPAHGQNLQALSQSYWFRDSAGNSYLETYVLMLGNTLTYKKNATGKFQASVELTILYSHADSVKNYFKYRLQSPELKDTSKLDFNLSDLKRIAIPPGNYVVDVQVKDLNSDSTRMKNLSQEIFVDPVLPGLPSFSSLELIESISPTETQNVFSRGGFDLKPVAINYFSPSMNELGFYVELYKVNALLSNTDFVFKYYIRNWNSGKVPEGFSYFKKDKAAARNFLSGSFNITSLRSGNYDLVIDVLDQNGNVAMRDSVFFQRAKRITPEDYLTADSAEVANSFVRFIPIDSLEFCLRSINPIAEPYEQDVIADLLALKNESYIRKYFYHFWYLRNTESPQFAWLQYKRVVMYVEGKFATPIMHGFETDPGRIYLQYGAPNSIEAADNEPGANPYQIWHYYKLEPNQTNVKFIFVAMNRASNDYKLIHSDAIGEIKDARWKYKVYSQFKDMNGSTNLDNTNFRDTWGSHINDLEPNK